MTDGSLHIVNPCTLSQDALSCGLNLFSHLRTIYHYYLLSAHKEKFSPFLFCCLSSSSPSSFLSSVFNFPAAGSAGNSHSSAQMNSYSDSGYQDASSGYHSSQNMGKAELRIQHSFPGACTGTLGRSARAEGQASAQVRLIAVCYMEPSAW